MIEFVGTKLLCILWRAFTEATLLYCVNFISCILYCVFYDLPCNMWASVYLGFVMCGWFDHCVSVLVIYALVCNAFLYFSLYIFFLIVTIVRNTATESKNKCNKYK